MNINPFVPYDIEPSWKKALEKELAKPYILSLKNFVEKERMGGKPVYPPRELVFNALWRTPLDNARVVIVGQDPYHGPGQAHGLSFSVPKGVPVPPSLMNIYKELESDLGISKAKNGCLTGWADQGVLLLNATLTVRQGEPMSHHGKGWERLTDAIISTVACRNEPAVFILWGKSAQEKCSKAVSVESHHLVLTSSHPSPFSAHRGFLGSKHFSKSNNFLRKHGKTSIDWGK